MDRNEHLHGGFGRPDRLQNSHEFDRCGIMRACHSIFRQQLDDDDLSRRDCDPLGRGFFLYGGSGECRERLCGYKLQSL
jgi:hypothetical protein